MIDVLYFAWVRERIGLPRETVETQAATVADLVEELKAREPRYEAAFADLYEAAGDLVLDAVVAQSEGQRAALWELRESLPIANRRIGAVSSHDISVPIAAIPAFIDAARAVVAQLGDFRINCFGHVGDGNLHFNVFPAPGRSRDDEAPRRDAVKRAVHDLVVSFDGSVSAEHGVGRLKVEDLERYEDPAKLSMMRALKAALDPRGILNPGAVLRAQG
ncbi:MAG: MoaD/ThiS family protein, partial [Sphingomonadales bacterium]|nr:MoaD/ThiS family protein [Sphingomonadales bacterium]